ncbi:MAG TPA: AraC family ligand binding domain-containing protein, partial [Opitutaceae bacterium]|nr:AraC family ligand binding domain-containing protein [Opitutaceae bacterium]
MTHRALTTEDIFFEYSPASAKARTWAAYSTASGFTHVPPNTPYPPARHPDDHHFTWDRGRLLHEYQIVYISKGRGRFESSESKSRVITPETAFILFPGVWHRYRPDAETGWSEFWIELQGLELNRMQNQGLISPKRPVHHKLFPQEMQSYFQEAHRLTRQKPRGFQVRVGLIGLQILALLEWSGGDSSGAPRRIDGLITDAQALMTGDQESSLSVESIASRLGVGYSYFRRNFKRQTGFSPKQYQAEL